MTLDTDLTPAGRVAVALEKIAEELAQANGNLQALFRASQFYDAASVLSDLEAQYCTPDTPAGLKIRTAFEKRHAAKKAAADQAKRFGESARSAADNQPEGK